MEPTISNVLPPEAVAALQKAAATKIPAADPLRRQKAIESTTQRIKQQYPQFFNIKEIQNEDQAQ